MCLMVKISLIEANEFVPPSELPSFNLDDIGCLVHCLYLFGSQEPEVPGNLSHCTISKYYDCEDG